MLSCLGKEWVFRSIDEDQIAILRQKYGISEILARILSGRKIPTLEVADFLQPTLRSLLPNPRQLTDMDRAVQRVVEALKNQESITIYGDYDVDGATATSLLIRFFRCLGYSKVSYYIPDRIKEGYGLNKAALAEIRKHSSLVIAVDCGTPSVAEIDYANQQGLSSIILDHHQVGPVLPNTIVVNPQRDGDEQNQKTTHKLCAAGVVFLFLVALHKALRETESYEFFAFKKEDLPNLMEFLDLVALGTVCDVMPLYGVNRAFVQRGLEVMKRGQNLGLKILGQVSNLSSDLSVYHLGFALGPRINAGGRIGTSTLGTQLLTSQDETEARQLATQLHILNLERRELEKHTLEEARTKFQERIGLLDCAIFVGDPAWHPGVIGIVASRLKELYNRPTFVYTVEDGVAKGSCRSVEGFDIGAVIRKAYQEGLLLSGGGHTMAAGFSFDLGRESALRIFLTEQARGFMKNFLPQLFIDAKISLSGASIHLIDELSKMEPFGTGNPEPRFHIEHVWAVSGRVVGDQHVQCRLRDESGKSIRAIAFKCAQTPLGQILMEGQQPLKLVGTFKKDLWNGGDAIQMMIEDAAF